MNRLELAKLFIERLEDNEEHMGEGAAHALTCEQFKITVMQGYDLIMLVSEVEE